MMQEEAKKINDRKLGDEWSGWTGAGEDAAIDEGLSVFLALGAIFVVLFAGLALFLWFMVKPRVEQISPALAASLDWGIWIFIALSIVSVFVEGFLLAVFRRTFMPHRWTQKLLLAVLPFAVWLGGKAGISRDRTGNSFIKLHNLFVMGSSGLRAERILVLLPRCLKKEARAAINDRVKGEAFRVYTAAGGEEARETIRQYRPTCILAIACERDLMSGLKDVAEKIPVLAVANRRPEGPCKNTDFSIQELEEALDALKKNRLKRI